MLNLIARYQAYLAGKAQPLDGLELSMAWRGYMLPWLPIPLISIIGCKVFGASPSTQAWLLGMAVLTSLFGTSLVTWEFIIKPLRNDYQGAKEFAKRDKDKPN